MKRFKGILRQVHLCLGLLSGLIVFTVAITGCMYAFEEEIRGYVYKDLFCVKAEAAPAKPIDEIIREVKLQYPKQGIKNIRVKGDPSRSVEVTLKNKQSVYVNPYSGKLLGTATKDSDFFGTVLKIHRTLYLGEVGKKITGVSAVIFMSMLISGIILWWPKGRKNIQRKFSVKRNALGARLIYDLHSVLGFYASWIIIFTALTGIIWSFKWAENSLYWISKSRKEETKHLRSAYSKTASAFSLDKIVTLSKEISPEAEDYFINLPEDSQGTIRVLLHYSQSGFFKKTDQLFFDQYSGKLLKSLLYKNSSTGDKVKATNYNIHTGKVLGLTGQLLVFFAALIVASLPVTGFIMWNKKGKEN